MNYEEKYNEALERARKELQEYVHKDCDDMTRRTAITIIHNLFPELKESEDERIRKELICFVENWKKYNHNSPFDDYAVYTSDRDECDKILAWLEKQGETFTKKDVDDAYLKGVCDAKHELEKQGENPTNKIDRKFKVGDWIINTNSGLIWKITSILNYIYYIRDVNGNEGYETYDGLRDNYHLWSIQDANDGDVLVSSEGNPFIFNGKYDDIHFGNPIAYCGVNCENKFKKSSGTHWTNKNGVYPATKEQQDLLFSKMKEAGYEWDGEKKELKKIESKKLDSDKVIEWLKPYSMIVDNIIDKFKKDFGLC